MTSYNTIEKTAVAEFKDRGSKFISYAFPIASSEDFGQRLHELKKEHPKASHHCFAYRLGIDGNDFRVNDDGEPAGSAGRPILGQIDSRQLTNVLIVVVRYFGGTLLGKPGLIYAYKTAASLALQAATVVTNLVEISYQVRFDYSKMNAVMQIVKQYDCAVLKRETNSTSLMEISIPLASLEECLQRLELVPGIGIKKNSGN